MFSDEAAERYIEILDMKTIEVWEGAAAAKKNDIIPWSPYPLTRARKIWQDYMRYGFVRDERGIEDMMENFLNRIATIDAITTLTGHTSQDPKNVIEDLELAYDLSTWHKLCDYAVDEEGSYRISDYGLIPLQVLAGKLLEAKTAEEKLLLLDQVLNVVHQRSDLASWFVKGGRGALEELSTQNNYKESFT